MAVLMRLSGGNWEPLKKTNFERESDLQEMLYASPELVAKDGEGAIAFTRECGLPGSGYTDLIGVTTSGKILIIETKLARNQEIRRKVIGQVLEYAAFLWGMSFEQLDSFFVANEGKSLLDILIEKDSSIDRDRLRDEISNNLKDGSFELVIAVDEINPELEKIIAFLSSCKAAIQLEALEVESYKTETVELVVPHRYGQIASPSTTSSSKTTLDELISGAEDEHARRLLRLVSNTWLQAGYRLYPGLKGASCRAEIPAEETVFCIYPSSLESCLKHLEKCAPNEVVAAYRQRLSSIQGFPTAKFLTGAYPNLKWASVDEVAIGVFLRESLEFVTECKRVASLSNAAVAG
jgi:hypothetical protein